MINNASRVGNFTSSEIAALTTVNKQRTGFGAPALTYIRKKNMERRLGRTVKTESNARPLVWGKLLEPLVFSHLGLSYTMSSQETDTHPTINYWAGSKDGTNEAGERAVIDFKCPQTLDSFCGLVDPIYEGLTGMDAINAIREIHKDGEKYYWQLVSNAIINNCDYAELIVFAPYLSELPTIREMAEGNPACYWIWSAPDEELPYLHDGGYYKNVNTIRFKVPQEDKDFLTECVEKAGLLLTQRPSTHIVLHDPAVNAIIHDKI